MFKIVYFKLQQGYKSIAKLYSSYVVNKSLYLIAFYFIYTLCLSIWLFQAKVIEDNQSLTFIKNSDYLRTKNIIEHEFPQDQKTRYFQNQLTDLGFYAEVIFKLKSGMRSYPPGSYYSDSETNNFINSTILEEYNLFYDSIINFTIEDDYMNPEIIKNQTILLSYRDLCPRRTNKPAVEGGIVRNEKFQKDLLKNEVSYLANDPGALIIDAIIQDGTSGNFVFGKLRKQECRLDLNGKLRCYITHVGQIRNRFDLLSETEKDRYLAVKFMHKFAEYLETKQSDTLEFSFHTSHTLETEIIKYSVYDMKYVLASLVLFWLAAFLKIRMKLT